MLQYMNQGDLFKLIIDLKFSNNIGIARAITECSDDDYLDEDNICANISRIINGNANGKPLKNMRINISEGEFCERLFSVIFKDCDIEHGANAAIADAKFQEIKEYLQRNELTFIGQDDSADCKSFVVRMIYEAMRRHKLHTASDIVTSNSGETPRSEQLSVQGVSPILHNQKIFCPSKFYGRKNTIEEMHDKLCSYNLVILSGIGGIGKTYLSRQYAHIYSDEYKFKQVVTYDKAASSFKKTILAISFDNLFEQEISDDGRFEKRMSLLKKMGKDTLLIIDNVDSTPEDLYLFDDLCKNSDIHIIITTRLTDCFPPDQTIKVRPLPVDVQIEFFKAHYHDNIADEELPIIKQILSCIEGHTLLIELVAKSMHATALSPSQMLDYLTEKKYNELEPVYINKDNLSSEKKSMYDFVKLLFDIGYLTDNLKEALLYLSLLPNEGVNRRFFYNLMPKYRSDFNDLISNSWAIDDTNENKLRLHPVIRDMVRKEMRPSSENCNTVLSNLHSHMQTYGDNLSINDKKDICSILKSIEEIDGFYANCLNVTMLAYFANFCFEANNFELALSLYQKAAVIAVDSPIQTQTDIYIKLGDVYKRLALLKDSIDSYTHALENNEQLQNGTEKNLIKAYICGQLSDTYRKNSDYDKALEFSDTALKIYNAPENNPEQKNLAEIYNRRGIIYLNMASRKDLPESIKEKLLYEALSCYQTGLKIREECHDTDRQIAYSYHNVGTAYNKLGHYDLALENHKKALDIRKSITNDKENDVDIASSLVWVGNDLLAKGEPFWDMAKTYFDESLAVRESVLGKSHPEVAWSLISISDWYEKKGDIANALVFAERALKIRENALPASHNYVQQAKNRVTVLRNKIA